jgi:hypothetical protein
MSLQHGAFVGIRRQSWLCLLSLCIPCFSLLLRPEIRGESSTRTTRPNLMAQLRRSIAEVKGKHQLGALPLRAACTPSSDLRSTNVYHCDDSNPK